MRGAASQPARDLESRQSPSVTMEHSFRGGLPPLSRLRRAKHGESAAPITEIFNDIGTNLKQELFGDRTCKESSIRFTVDIPESLNKRLAQLSVDTGKPKTELVRTILDRALNSLNC